VRTLHADSGVVDNAELHGDYPARHIQLDHPQDSPTASRPSGRSTFPPSSMKLFLLLSIPLLILDQATKWWIVDNFNPPSNHVAKAGCEEPYSTDKYNQIEAIPGFFNIVRVHNTGMAWGIGNGTNAARIIFPIIACFAIGMILWLWRKNAFPTLISKIAVALLLPGILGNLIDRLLPCRGYVVDFLDFILPGYVKLFPNSGGHFPSFNVADSCICIAAALLIISAFKGEPEDDNNAPAPPAEK